jgi:hypothetical protein
MPKIPRARGIVSVANAAALPTSGFEGAVRVVDDDGTGNPGLAIWDIGTSSYRIVTGERFDFQESVLSMSFNDPSLVPAPSAGDRYIVAAGGVGAWAGRDDDIATWDGIQWDFYTPTEGTTCEVEDLNQFYTYNGAAWVPLPTFMGVVSGTPPSTDHAIARYDGVTGLLIQDSDVTIDDNGNIDLGGASANITATATIAIDDHYSIAELDAAPVAAGAKIDKIVGTDDAIVKSDGATGDVQDSNHIISDNGDLENTGTSAITKTSDKTGASNSVTIAHKTGDVTGGGATGTSGDSTQETGATVDGKSGDLKRTAGIPTGTGARGDTIDEARLHIRKLGNKDGSSYLAVLDVDGDAVFVCLDDATGFFAGTTANKTCQIRISSFDAASSAGLNLYSSFLSTKEGEFVYNHTVDKIILASAARSDAANTKDVDILTGAQSNVGDFDSGALTAKTGTTNTLGDSGDAEWGSGNAADDSGDAIVSTGTAGGTRGDVKLDGLNIQLIGGQIIKRTPVADAGHTLAVGEYLIAYTSITAARTVDLPAVASVPAGSVFIVKDESGAVTGVNKITIDPNLAETIDGVATLDIVTAYGAVEFYTNGSAWFTK